jgi:hypothetical protein
METIVKERVNVAPSSDEGHFVQGARRVVNLETDVTEAFYVDGPSELVTKNHTTLKQDESCLVNCQMVYNPFTELYTRSVD